MMHTILDTASFLSCLLEHEPHGRSISWTIATKRKTCISRGVGGREGKGWEEGVGSMKNKYTDGFNLTKNSVAVQLTLCNTSILGPAVFLPCSQSHVTLQEKMWIHHNSSQAQIMQSKSCFCAMTFSMIDLE